MGGIYPTLFPEKVIENPLVDVICIGEGEISLSEFLEKLRTGEISDDVEGIWYKEKSGKLHKSKIRPFMQDLSNLPLLNYSYWDIANYLRVDRYFIGSLPFLSSRGCPFNCRFCSNGTLKNLIPGKLYRVRPVKDIIEEIKINYQKYNFRIVNFADEVFGLSKPHFEELVAAYCREGLHKQLPWTCETRADIITEGWCKLAKESGCILVSVGIETGNEYRRRVIYNKNITNEQIKIAVENLKKYNIMYKFNFIIGGPEENKNSLKDTFKMIDKYKPLFVLMWPYIHLPKTDIWTKGDKIVESRRFQFILFRFKIKQLFSTAFKAFSMRKIKFLKDILVYILNIRKCRPLKLWSDIFLFNLKKYTLLEYTFQEKYSSSHKT
ncbi:MAG: B12-binding domain-containing radical SAM protein [Candidatus Omnitrophica bacterium]|nr:B12-binding domain-containing radical SAM protein [Candidatus Omnitrophota bacterium]